MPDPVNNTHTRGIQESPSGRHPSPDRYGRDCSVLRDKRLFLLDMDGTLYEEDRLFKETPDFLKAVREIGGRYVFVTNNSSRSVADYVRKLERLGIESDPGMFMTSSQAAALYIREHHAGAKVFCMGTNSLIEELCSEGICVTQSVEPDIDMVLLGYDNELTYEKLSRVCEILSTRSPELPYLATNCDWVCPCRFGFVPDCGSFAQMIEHATQRLPIFLGKPEPTMLELAMTRYGVAREQCCVVGDRLYTDIAAGLNAGMTTVCVLSGEAGAEQVDALNPHPDYTLDHVGVLARILRAEL